MPLSHPRRRPPATARRAAVVRLAILLAALTTAAFTWAPGASQPGAPASFDVPVDAFRQAMGYVPTPAPGRPDVLLSPDAECSTPTGGSPFGFDDACREHDLAYDLLRYDRDRGAVVDPWDRWSADTRFGLRMVERCTEQVVVLAPCLATAAVYRAAVGVNSVRQLYGAPADETGVQIAGSSLAMAALAVLVLAPTAAARAFRRMLRLAEVHLTPPPAWSGWSGAAGSLVRWADLGREGRRLLTRAPVAEGALRVVVGLESARRLDDRVALALAEAERVGAFTRGTVCVATPTGSGWLNPAAVEALELATGGDVATLTVPYAAAPSWLAALAHPGAHRRSSVALLAAVHGRWERLPRESRPRLVVLGESLGANGMADALRRLPHVRADVAGGLLVGGVRSASWEAPGRVALVRHDDDPVVTLGLRTVHRLPGAGQAPEGHGHHYGAELGAAWREDLGALARPPAGCPPGRPSQDGGPMGASSEALTRGPHSANAGTSSQYPSVATSVNSVTCV